MMSNVLSITEAKHLLKMCRRGRLFDVQNWIASGNPLSVPAELGITPLEVAIDIGFHSLVEILIRSEVNQGSKNRALQRVLTRKRLDLVELVVSHGAEISTVPFGEVLLLWDPTIIRYFLEQGADFITGSPFSLAFGERIRTAIGPWRECKENYPNLAPQLQEQADRALRHFCFKGDLKWVSLLMWAGADPRSSGPTLDDSEGDESEYVTALMAAAYCKNVEILKRLKPDIRNDDIEKLFRIAAGSGHPATAKYLSDLGAGANDKPNGGSSAFDDCLERFRFESLMYSISFTGYRSISKASKYSVSDTRDTIQLLIERGALWRPDSSARLSRVRRGLLECEPDVTLELVERLVKHSACNQGTIHELLRTPTIKKHVLPLARRFVAMGFDVRTREQKVEDLRRKEASHQWALNYLATKYNRQQIYEEFWSEPIQHVAKKYKMSDVGLAKICRKLNIPRPGRGYWAIKAAGKPLPKRPRLSE